MTLEADDNHGGLAAIDVTIHLADVDEPPGRPAAPMVEVGAKEEPTGTPSPGKAGAKDAPIVTPFSTDRLGVRWNEPANTGPDIHDYDVQYREGTSGSFLPWPHTGTDLTATLTGLSPNTRYQAQVRASNDEGSSEWSPSGEGRTSANQPPVFDESAPARSLIENSPAGLDIGSPVSATDPEGGTVSYGLVGGDTESFTVVETSGQLQTRAGVDYNFEAKNRYSVSVEATDEQGGSATIAVTIELIDHDHEQPGQPDAPTVTASTRTSLTVRWTEPANTGPPINDYDVQYREAGGTFADWPHTGTRTSTTLTGLTANTQYQVQVRATSDEGTSPWSELVTVSTVANQAPTFNEGSSTSRSLAENTTGTHDIGNPVTATDSDGGTLTYRLEGADAASFDIVSTSGQLRTKAGVTYDHETKDRYEVGVRVEDGQGGSNTIEVTVALIDQQEPPGTPASPRVVSASSTSLTVSWEEPTNTGPGIHDYDVQYREGASGGFTSWPHNSTDLTATITNLTPGTGYQVQVRAHNAEGTSEWSDPGTGSTGANQQPVFTDGSSATRRLDENTEGVQNIGDPISATDPEGTALTYSLEGQDADAFTINSSNGQLRTKSGQTYTYDYETKPSYFVNVKATDGNGGSSTIVVLIHLNDLNEPPAITSDAAFEVAENVQHAGQVTAEDVDRDDSITNYTISGGVGDGSRFEITSQGVLSFKDGPDFENPSGSGGGNRYIVVVTVTGGTGGRALTAEQTITVTVTDENEPPHFTSDDAFTVNENVQSAW